MENKQIKLTFSPHSLIIPPFHHGTQLKLSQLSDHSNTPLPVVEFSDDNPFYIPPFHPKTQQPASELQPGQHSHPLDRELDCSLPDCSSLSNLDTPPTGLQGQTNKGKKEELGEENIQEKKEEERGWEIEKGPGKLERPKPKGWKTQMMTPSRMSHHNTVWV